VLSIRPGRHHHKNVHVAVAFDHLGRRLDQQTAPSIAVLTADAASALLGRGR
jgi:hypothetical protein